ncbi:hypothetical protein ACN6KF_006717 [Labrys sp. La1]
MDNAAWRQVANPAAAAASPRPDVVTMELVDQLAGVATLAK